MPAIHTAGRVYRHFEYVRFRLGRVRVRDRLGISIANLNQIADLKLSILAPVKFRSRYYRCVIISNKHLILDVKPIVQCYDQEFLIASSIVYGQVKSSCL